MLVGVAAFFCFALMLSGEARKGSCYCDCNCDCDCNVNSGTTAGGGTVVSPWASTGGPSGPAASTSV